MEFVITRYRWTNANLRSQFLRLIARAGERAWPKLFHNLRSTRQTELTELFPTHVVCAWLGNSETVAQNHYLQVRDQHFAMAVGDPNSALDRSTPNASTSKTTQKTTLHAAELARTGSHADLGAVA